MEDMDVDAQPSISSSTLPAMTASPTGTAKNPIVIDGHSFEPFVKLPVEVRLKIWSLNLPGPRLVEVIFSLQDECWYSSAPPIANLGVCKESRQEALKTHPLSFAIYHAPALVPFNFATDTLFLGRKLQDTHVFFRRHCIGDDLGKVRFLMVDAFLKWGVRTSNNRGWRFCRLSHLIFSGVKEYTAIYSSDVDPLPSWALSSWFPSLSKDRFRRSDPQQVMKRIKANWPLTHGRVPVHPRDCEENRFGAISENQKFDPAIKCWRIPKVHSMGVTREVIASFNLSKYSSWPEILMDRAIEDIFD